MAKVTLEIASAELDTFLTVIKALKPGIVQSINIDKKHSYNTPKPIQKEPLKPVSLSSKYVDPQTFKERLKRMRNGQKTTF